MALNKIKRLLETSADRLGYRVIPKWKLEDQGISPFIFPNHLRKLFKGLSIDTVFDIGANQGYYRDFLRQEVGFQGRIFSYEPVPELAGHLRNRAQADPLWQVFNLGIGSSNGSLTLNIMRGSTLSSFLEPTTKGTSYFQENNTPVKKHEVAVKTLDSILAENETLSNARIYLKIDTQGYDLEVLKGAKANLSRILALQTELSITPIYENMPTYIEVLTYLDSMNFSPNGFFPVGGAQTYQLIEVDCCMINNAFKSIVQQ